VSRLPCDGPGPDDPAERRKWALDGLQAFYPDLPFENEDKTLVADLSNYQKDIWCDRWERAASGLPKVRIVIKGQKIGETYLHLLEDIHVALSTRGRGREIVIAAQNALKAQEHLRHLKDMLRASRYAPLLVEAPLRARDGTVRRDTASRVNMASIINPDDPDGPTTRIWAIGIGGEGQLVSNTSVVHLHLSDIMAAENVTAETLDTNINVLRSRILKSRGTMVIETMPGAPSGYVYREYRAAARQRSMDHGEDLRHLVPGEAGSTEWSIVRRLPSAIAVEQKVLTQDTLDRDRDGMANPYKFARYYEANFLAGDLVAYPDPVKITDDAEATALFDMFMREDIEAAPLEIA